jgi:hypothetical protein
VANIAVVIYLIVSGRKYLAARGLRMTWWSARRAT